MFSISDKSIELLKRKASSIISTDVDKIVVEYEEKTIFYDKDLDYHSNIYLGTEGGNEMACFLLSFSDITRYSDEIAVEEKFPTGVAVTLVTDGGNDMLVYRFKENDNKHVDNLNSFFSGFHKITSQVNDPIYKDSTFVVRYLIFSRK